MIKQEAVEREVCAATFKLNAAPRRLSFAFPGSAGELRQAAVNGALEISTTQVADDLCKLSARIVNETTAPAAGRDETMLRAFVSTHTILNVTNGVFVSLLDPPEQYQKAAAACRNVGTYPVLVGAEGERDCLLSSPIILYDYPQIAPESAGDLFDGTEIDEILTLRILTLTDEEKRELRAGDERARQLLERSEALSAEQLLKLHSAWRGARA